MDRTAPFSELHSVRYGSSVADFRERKSTKPPRTFATGHTPSTAARARRYFLSEFQGKLMYWSRVS